MTGDGAWIRMEEYELLGDETEIKSMFAVFAGTEELLNSTPLDQYSALLNVWETQMPRMDEPGLRPASDGRQAGSRCRRACPGRQVMANRQPASAREPVEGGSCRLRRSRQLTAATYFRHSTAEQ